MVLTPESEDDLVEIIRAARDKSTPLALEGSGSKRGLGAPTSADDICRLENLSGILAYEPEELVISAWAGTPLAEIEAALADRGQHLAFEPPRYQTLAGETGKGTPAGTLGGLVAAGFSGPRRIAAGALRDHILGVSAVTGRGELFKVGGRVVKNVSGYDLSKLLAGSWGTLAALTRITLKVLPRPPQTRTLFVKKEGAEGLSLLRHAAASPFSVTGAVMGRAGSRSGLLIRLEGQDGEIDERMASLQRHLSVEGAILTQESEVIWQDMRDLTPLSGCKRVWALHLPRSQAAALLDLSGDGTVRLFDWAGARIFLGERDGTDIRPQMEQVLSERGGKARLLMGEGEDFPEEPPALKALSARVKATFDPDHILTPGRMGAL